IPKQQINAFTHKDNSPKLLVQTFEARCEIHRIPESRVAHALGRAEVADHCIPDMNAKPREEWLQTLSFELGVELFASRSGRNSRPAGSLNMVGLWIGRVPEHHHGVTNELVDCSAFGEERFCKHRKIAGHLVHESVGGGGPGGGRKIPDLRTKGSKCLS